MEAAHQIFGIPGPELVAVRGTPPESDMSSRTWPLPTTFVRRSHNSLPRLALLGAAPVEEKVGHQRESFYAGSPGCWLASTGPGRSAGELAEEFCVNQRRGTKSGALASLEIAGSL